MRTLPLGEAGVQVSALCLGCMFFGTRVGEDLSRAAIRAAVDGSLRRLGTDRIDLYYAHIDHRTVPLEETLDAFGELVTAGKVRHIGCSNYAAWRVERARRMSDARGVPRYCCVQQRHSYLRPRPGSGFGVQLVADDSLLDFCATNPEVAMLAYSPPLAGAFTTPDRPFPDQYLGADTDARLAALEDVARATGATRNQVVLAWLMATSPSAIPLIAASTEAQLDENLGALAVELSPEQVASLNTASA